MCAFLFFYLMNSEITLFVKQVESYVLTHGTPESRLPNCSGGTREDHPRAVREPGEKNNVAKLGTS